MRSVTLTPEQARRYEQLIRDFTAGRPSPYQEALLAALRAFTARDAAPNAAWRKALGITAN